MRTTPIQGFKGYQHYPYTGLQEILRLPVYKASRDMKATSILGFKRFQDYYYTGLHDISGGHVYGLEKI